jgi:serine/threonine protein kinase
MFMILNGLKILHSRKIVHGNLFPRNIFLDIYGNIKLHYYGLSIQPVTFADDIYMVGYIMYKMMKGKSPLPDVNDYRDIPRLETKLKDVPFYDWKKLQNTFRDEKIKKLIKNMLEDVYILVF